jgi:GT2 family glycosyltransferase/tetratricopeptide (TPR) repeat protein
MNAHRPAVISILTLNNLPLLKQCLASIFDDAEGAFRVCVLDQGTTDGTEGFLSGLGDQVDVVRVPKNVGFVTGNNMIIERYPEHDVVMLNDDTIVKKGWLRALRERAYSSPQIGIVGAKLLYPDGRLQEAGGEIFSDGSGRNVGKNDDASRYIYNQVRDVDYCSGACLFIKREVLSAVGGLDEIFSPAYWEDTDLCFRARKAGWRVVYEPRAEVTHFEGATSGSPDMNSLSRRLQERNKPRFMERWGDELKKHRRNVFEIRSDTGKDKILVVMPFLPMYDRAAGEKRWFHTLKILSKRYDVVFLARNGLGQQKYINDLEAMGITVFHTDQTRLANMGIEAQGPVWIDFPLLLESNDFKAVILGFYHLAHQYYRELRAHSPKSLMIIDSFDLCFIRERRKAGLAGDPRAIWKAAEVKRQELAMYRRADMVLTVTEADRETLRAEVPGLDVGISTDIHPMVDQAGVAGRRDLVFVGNFKHDPNEDAVLYFAREIFPAIRRQLPDVKLNLVGNSPGDNVQALASADTVVTGFVPDVTPYLMRSRVYVVPLRYGAGLKGKIGEALAAGIPVVTTSIGAEGMGLSHRQNAMIADDPEEFAACVVEVYRDDALWENLSREGRRVAEASYSYGAVEKYWREVFDRIAAGRRPAAPEADPAAELRRAGFVRRARAPEIVPRVSIVIPVHDNLKDTRDCWLSIKKNTAMPHEIVIVDNGSTEDVVYEADQNNLRVVREEVNTGFAQACNLGIRATQGEYVVILNNDTMVTPGWLERLVWHLDRDPAVGIVGPSTNFARGVQQIPVEYASEKQLYDFSERIGRQHAHAAVAVDKIVGVCMVMRRRMLEDVGLFDTRFGIGNYEDDDICLRARLGGYSVLWVKDAFVHHKGSRTFQALKIDYAALMEANRKKYLDKWALAAPAGRARAASVVDGEPAEQGQASGGSAGPQSSSLMIIGAGVRGLSRRMLAFAAEAPGDTLLFSMQEAITPLGWSKPLEAALARDGVGCAFAASNLGLGPQRIETGVRSAGKALAKFARKNALERQGMVEYIDVGIPAAVAVKKAVLLQHGLASGFDTAAILMDLARAISDTGLKVVCAMDSYVHLEQEPSGRMEQEAAAVIGLLNGRAALDRDDARAALECLDGALASKPDYAEALYERGIIRALAGFEAEALADFRAAIAARPEDSRAHNNLGCILFRQGDTGAAETHFKQAFEVSAANWEAKKNLADLYMATGRARDGLDLYSRIIDEHGDCPDAYVALGHVFGSFGDLDTADFLFGAALKLSPDSEEARRGQATIAVARATAASAEDKRVGTKM